jgi:hypothetical protein
LSGLGHGRARSSLTRSESVPDPARCPLAQLIHALNQPVTGLQCSMEVALASPRTNEQYAQGLRDGLKLTERMRELVQAIQEATELQNQNEDESDRLDLHGVLRGAMEDLIPIAEEKRLGIVMEFSALWKPKIQAAPRQLQALAFRLLESVMTQAREGTELKVETGSVCARGWLRLQWQGEPSSAPLSRAGIGLLVAQAGWERLGAEWERRSAGEYETLAVSVRSPIGRLRADSEERLSAVIST